MVKASITPLREDDGRFRNYPVFPYENGRGFELHGIERDKDCHLESEPHPPGTRELLTVFSGKLPLAFSGHDLAVKAGASARFRADAPHAHTNVGGELRRLSMVICYPE